jgi:hypothetical protein
MTDRALQALRADIDLLDEGVRRHCSRTATSKCQVRRISTTS